MEKMLQEQVSREKDILDIIDRLVEKLTKREKEFKDEMDKLEKEITNCHLEQVEEQNQRAFEKDFTKGNDGCYERVYRIGRKEGYEEGYYSTPNYILIVL